MKLGGNLPLRNDTLLFSISGTGHFICPVAQTRWDIYTKAFMYPVIMDHWVKVEVLYSSRQIRKADLSVHSRTRQPAVHNDRPKSQDQYYYTPGPQRGNFSKMRVMSATAAPPRAADPSALRYLRQISHMT